MAQEHNGAAHRITSSRTQDQSTHHQITQAPGGKPANNAVWHNEKNLWVDRHSGRELGYDEVEDLGLDGSLRQM